MNSHSTSDALIIENELPARQRLQLYLNSRGATFDSASDPRTAIERLSKSHYSVVFLDLDLGGGGTLEGSGVLAWMDRHGKHIPTVLISESSPFPSVIRLEKAYSHFVMLRMMHGDLDHVPDLVDNILARKTAASIPKASGTTASASSSYNNTFRQLPSGALTLMGIILLLLITFAVVATKVSSLMFVPIVIAAILTFVLIIIAWLMSAGIISENVFLKVLTAILKKIPGLKIKL